MSDNNQQMEEYIFAGKVALWSAFAAAAMVIVFWGIVFQIYLPAVMSALILVPVGAAVVAILITLSFLPEDETHAGGA